MLIGGATGTYWIMRLSDLSQELRTLTSEYRLRECSNWDVGYVLCSSDSHCWTLQSVYPCANHSFLRPCASSSSPSFSRVIGL